MAIYKASLKCKTKTGGVEKPALLSITTEADSREEALVRMRSAAARVLSKPGTKDLGDHLLTEDDSGNTTGELIPVQSPFSFGLGGITLTTSSGVISTEDYSMIRSSSTVIDEDDHLS